MATEFGMSVAVDGEALSTAVGMVGLLSKSRDEAATKAEFILFEAEAGRLLVRTHNRSLDAEIHIECDVQRDGAVALPRGRVVEYVSLLSGGVVEIEGLDGHGASIRCGGAEAVFEGIDPSDVPETPDPANGTEFTIPCSMLKDALGKAEFAICTDKARFNLLGVYMEIQEGTMTVVATDGHRMNVLTYSCPDRPNDSKGNVKGTVPSSAVRELRRLLDEDCGEIVTVYIENGQADFSFGLRAFELTCRLVGGVFPNHEYVISKSGDRKVVVRTEALLNAVLRAQCAINRRWCAVLLKVDVSQIRVEAKAPDVGKFCETIPAVYNGAPIEGGYDAGYLEEILRHIDTERVWLSLGKEINSAVLIQPDGEDGPSDCFRHVLMGMKV